MTKPNPRIHFNDYEALRHLLFSLDKLVIHYHHQNRYDYISWSDEFFPVIVLLMGLAERRS